MPKVHFTEQTLFDLERIFQFLDKEAPAFAITVGEEIVDATSVLQRHPLIGRPTPHNLRELVIAKGTLGLRRAVPLPALKRSHRHTRNPSPARMRLRRLSA